ncbi:cytochrome P450 [Trametes sanguinea]|nr:cytochrome P450 [Trametes sanguinea]
MLLRILLLCAAWITWKVVQVLRARQRLAKVPGPPSASLLTGNLSQLLDKQGWDFHFRIAEQYGSIVKLNWLFGSSALYVYDPLALQHILKDTATFDEMPWYLESNRLFLGPGVLGVSGHTHRRQRKMLLPVFSAKHLRGLVPVFYRVTHRLTEAISQRVQEGPADIDMLNWMSRTALELIGQSGIGHSFDPLTGDVADAYAEAVKNFTSTATCAEMMLLRQAMPLARYLGPPGLRRWLVERMPIPVVQKMLHIVNMLQLGSLKILEEKKVALKDKEGDQKDIISILLRANNAASEEDRLPDDELLGQMTSIIFAAMDTTSNALSRILHILAQYPSVQDKVRREVMEAKAHGDELDYDELHALPFLDAVCREALRLYPSALETFRGTMKDAVLPLSQPIRSTDGTLMTEIVVPRGTNIIVAIMASNRNKALWGEDAHEFKPERWLKPLPEALEKAGIPGVYSNLMTFLGGGRSCIGFTFSQLEMKVVLSELLAHFAFELSAEKRVVWNLAGISYPSTCSESTKGELWLQVRKL